jgi:hypothetical protein
MQSGGVETWLAAVEMAKADPIEEIPSGKKEIGGFSNFQESPM